MERTTMWTYKYNINNKKQTNTPFARIAGIQSNITWMTKQRKTMERRWIYWLGTKQPDGLNMSIFLGYFNLINLIFFSFNLCIGYLNPTMYFIRCLNPNPTLSPTPNHTD